MEYRVTLTLVAPAISDCATLAEHLDQVVDALMRVAPSTGPVVDATVGESNARVTLTVDASDVTEAVERATRFLATAWVPIAGVAVEPAGEPERIAL